MPKIGGSAGNCAADNNPISGQPPAAEAQNCVLNNNALPRPELEFVLRITIVLLPNCAVNNNWGADCYGAHISAYGWDTGISSPANCAVNNNPFSGPGPRNVRPITTMPII